MQNCFRKIPNIIYVIFPFFQCVIKVVIILLKPKKCGLEAVVDKTKNVSCDDNDKNVCYINELCSVRVINSTYNNLQKSHLINNKCERLIKLLQKVTDGHSHILK